MPLLPHVSLQLSRGVGYSFHNFAKYLMTILQHISPSQLMERSYMDSSCATEHAVGVIGSILEEECRRCVAGTVTAHDAMKNACLRMEQLSRNAITTECNFMRNKLPDLERIYSAFSHGCHMQHSWQNLFHPPNVRADEARAWLRALALPPSGTRAFFRLRTTDSRFAERLRSCGGWRLGELTLRKVKHMDETNALEVFNILQCCGRTMAEWLEQEIARFKDATVVSPEMFNRSGWNGVTVVDDQNSAEMLYLPRHAVQPPSHMASFAAGPLWVREDIAADAAHGLMVVRIVHVITQLLRDGHLPLDRIGNAYMRHIVRFEYAAYEQTCQRIVKEVLVPFGLRTGVPFRDDEGPLRKPKKALREAVAEIGNDESVL